MNDDQLRQLLNQTDAAIGPPRIGDQLGEAIRRRYRGRRRAGFGMAGAGMLLLAFYAGTRVGARDRSNPTTLSPSQLLLENASEPPAPLPDESEFKLERAVLTYGIDAMPPWQPLTIRRLDIQY